MPSFSALAYLGIFLSGALGAILLSPFFGVLLYEIQYLTNPPARWWYGDLPDLRYSMVIMLFTCLGFFTRSARYTTNRVLSAPPAKWLVLIACLMIVTWCWAINPALHWEVTQRFLKVLLFVYIAYRVADTPEKIESLLAAYLVGIGYLSVLIWQNGRSGDGRVEGIGSADGSDANGTALIMTTAAPLLVFYALFGKRKEVRAAAVVGLAFILNSLVLLNSRGAFLALVASSAYFAACVLREKTLKAQKLKVIAGLVVAIGLFLYLADEVFWSRMNTIHSVQAGSDEGGTHRLDFWMTTFEMLKQYPFGGGARTFPLLSPQYLPAEWLSGGQRVVHSTWFQVLSEYGYHGACLFVAYVMSTVFLIRKARRSLAERDDIYHLFQGTALLSSWFALLVAASFIDHFYAELTFWLPMFIAAFANVHLSGGDHVTSRGKR